MTITPFYSVKEHVMGLTKLGSVVVSQADPYSWILKKDPMNLRGSLWLLTTLITTTGIYCIHSSIVLVARFFLLFSGYTWYKIGKLTNLKSFMDLYTWNIQPSLSSQAVHFSHYTCGLMDMNILQSFHMAQQGKKSI